LLLLRNPKVHFRVHTDTLSEPILSQLNPFNALTLYFSKTVFTCLRTWLFENVLCVFLISLVFLFK